MRTSAAIPFVLAGILAAGCGSPEASGAATPVMPSALAGNGIAGEPADVVLARAKAALDDAKSFRATGEAGHDGVPLRLDLTVSGQDLTATFDAGTELGVIELLAVDGTRFVRPDETA